jgi:uncharacterized protein (TIGR03437 family)
MRLKVALLLIVTALAASAQPASGVNCLATAVPTIVRTEGLSERVGDMLLNCSGGAPAATIRGELTLISFSGPITNKTLPNGALDIILTASSGSGEAILNTQAFATASNQVTFPSVQFNLSSTGTAVLRITNLRIAPPNNPEQPIRVALATVTAGQIRTDNAPFTVGITQRGLLASYSTTFVCTQSRLPETVSFPEFIRRGVRYASVRVTEGFSDSFQRKGPQTDVGTRILVRYAGFPVGARLFTPAVAVGSSGAIPTSAGDLGLPISGGRYFSAGNGQLLLSRVTNTDNSGAGGVPLFTPSGGVGTIDFDQLAEVTLTNGSGVAAFEVMDSVANLRESVQIPTFLILEQRPEGGSIRANVSLSLGPVSTVASPSATAPVPRFQEIAPPTDCNALGDCNSNLFPRLTVESPELTYDVIIGSTGQTRFIRVLNDGGGVLSWTASVIYRSGTGWLRFDPENGLNNATVRLDAVAGNGFPPGTYEATLVIDGGPLAGTRSANVRMVARNLTLPPATPNPEINAISHGAFQPGPLVPGSLGSLFGRNLTGTATRLTMDGLEGRILFADSRQINFQVPAELVGRPSAQAIVTVDGRQSVPVAVPLATTNPGIFPGAILNQDNSANTAANPADSGSVVQLFVTGLEGPSVTVRLHDRPPQTPLYAGPAPGLIGVQQVNAAVPADLQTLTTSIVICAGSACSGPQSISVRQPNP